MIRKVTSFISFLEIFVLISVFLLFVLTSRKSLDFVLSKVSKEYSLTYENAKGTLLTGIEIDKLYYKNRPLADEVVIDWRILPLFYKKVSFSRLELSSLNVDTALSFMKEFKKEEGGEDNGSSSLPALPFVLEAKKIYFSLSPYSYEGFDIKKFYFEVDDFETDLQDFYIESFKYFLDSNFLSLKIEGLLKDKNIYVNSLEAKRVNLKNILESPLLKRKNGSKKNEKSSSLNSQNKEPNLPVNGIVFEKADIEVKPYKYREYELESLKLKASGGFFDLQKYLYFDNISLNIKTNAADLDAEGKIDQNKIFANVSLFLNEKFLRKYSKEINFNSLNPIKAGLEISKETLRATIFTKSSNLLNGDLSKYDLKIKDMKTVVNYSFEKGTLHAVTDASLSSIYTGNIVLKHVTDLNQTLSYGGEISVFDLKNLPPDLLNMFKSVKVDYQSENKGKGIKGKVYAGLFEGDFYTKDFKNVSVNLSGEGIRYKEVNIKAKMKSLFDLQDIKKSYADLSLFTDYGDLKSKIKLTDPVNIFSVITPSIKLGVKPVKIVVDTNVTKNGVTASIGGKILNGSIRYDFDRKDLSGILKADSSEVSLKGNLNETLLFTFSSNSLRELEDKIREVYEFKKIPLDGEVLVKAKIDPVRLKVFADIKSKWFLYEYEENKFLVLENFRSSVFADEKVVKIKNYSFNIIKRKFFATKESDIYLNENNITVDKFFINDKAYVEGFYDKSKSEGKFSFKADRFKYEGDEGKIVLGADIDINLAKDKTEVEGGVTLYEGVITYEPANEYKVNDRDIIIIQRQKPEKKGKDTLSLNIRIESRKPIIYKVDGTEVKFNVDVTVWKEIGKKLQLLGMVKILKGRVEKQNKLFKIEDGEVLFGGPPSNPYLNIEISHEVKPYHITITVTGTLESPVILFSSDPYLSQSDILSLILFGTTSSELMEGGGSASNQVVSMFGNTLAKELADSLGIKLDRLALSAKEDGSIGVEIGKKITRNITLIYKNDVVSTIVVEIEHSPKFETDITIKPNSSGIDFIYKKEY